MTKTEAQQILEDNHYCVVHLVKMTKYSACHPDNAMPVYSCAQCVLESSRAAKNQLDEALALLGSKTR